MLSSTLLALTEQENQKVPIMREKEEELQII